MQEKYLLCTRELNPMDFLIAGTPLGMMDGVEFRFREPRGWGVVDCKHDMWGITTKDMEHIL